ncbi:hypothetical protein K474DRAFT_1497260 [Panus rudis PR-1116 ss-1]|nr:hypothetical protein K474DRAFT_1497260 [Panus rudis PR-1116 ss-1]
MAGPLTSRQKLILAEIEATEQKLHAFRANFNSDSPACRLPSELISIIISFLARDNFAKSLDYIYTEPPYRWIRATHFCRHWRYAALNHAVLWTTLYLTRHLLCTDFLPTMLSRSGKALLDVKVISRLGGSFHLRDDVVDLYTTPMVVTRLQSLMPELHRIRSLELPLNDNMNTIFAIVLNREAPELRSLRISVFFDAESEHPFIVGRTPHLTALHLSGINAAISPTFLQPSLTSLTLSTVHLTVGDILSALRQIPSLEYLTLSSLMEPGPIPDSLCVVELPCLRKLVISDEGDYTLRAVQYLSFPQTTHLELCTDLAFDVGSEYLTIDFPTIVGILSSILHKSAALTPLRVLRIYLTFDGLTISGIRQCIPSDPHKVWELQSDFVFVLGSVPMRFPNSALVNEALMALPLEKVQYLYLRDFRIAQDTWSTCLSRMKDLTVLWHAAPYSKSFDFPHLPHVLFIPGDNNSTSHFHTPIMFPKLERLRVIYEEDIEESAKNHLEYLQRLSDVLHSRQRAGLNLTLEYHFIGDVDTVLRLRMLDRLVFWDRPRPGLRDECDHGWLPKEDLPAHPPVDGIETVWT